MRIPTAILGALAIASICPLAQARVIDTSKAYTNPDTVPVLLKIPSTSASYKTSYHPLPYTLDLTKYYKEFTSPGPVLNFTVNTPTTTTYGTAVPNTFKMQLWFLDPTPDTPVDNDKNYTQDNDDTRIVLQNLDLNEPNEISYMIVNAVGHSDGDKATLPGTLFWDSESYQSSPKDNKIVLLQGAVYQLADNETSHITKSDCAWISPYFKDRTYTAGTVGLLYSSTSSTNSLIYNLEDNTTPLALASVATIGQVDDDGLKTLRAIAGITDTYELATPRSVSAGFTSLPLWNTYTDDDYDAYKQPDRSDFIQITGITMTDPTGTEPSHGLKYIEDQPYDSDLTDDKVTLVDANAAFKTIFNVSLTEDGLVTFSPRDDISISKKQVGSYYFYYRVYVNDGTNNGLVGTDYYRSILYVTLTYPFSIYLSGASHNSQVDKSAAKDSSNLWDWYSSSAYGWWLEQDFPNNRWVYSVEHGWVYMYGDRINSEDGVYWYDSPLNYPNGSNDTSYVDDEVGWLWTRSDFYSYFFSYKDNGWIYYFKDATERTLDKRLFWSYRQNAYITPSGEDTTYKKKAFSINGKKFGTGL